MMEFSTTEISVSKVTGALELVKEFYENRYAKEVEYLIEDAMKPRFFGLVKAKTRQEAIKKLDSGDMFSTWNLLKSQRTPPYWYHELNALCEHSANGIIVISGEDMRRISKYLKGEMHG